MDMMWYRRRGLMVTPHIESVTGSIASFNSDYNKIPVKSLICDIEPIQEGEGDPSPDNVRPISGRTGLNVTRCGKNLLPMSPYIGTGKTENGITYTLNNDGTVSAAGTATGRTTLNINHVVLKPGRYVVSGCPESGTSTTYRLRIGVNGYDGTLLATDYGNGVQLTITDDTEVYIRLYVERDSGTVDLLFKPMISLLGGDYEPYQGSSYSVNWETEAGTVYGGTLDVVSGKLTVDRAIETITKDSNWYSFSTGSGNSSAVVQLANIPLYVTGSSNKNGSICSSGLELQNYWTSARQNESGITDNGYAYTQTGVLRFHRLDISTITTLAEFKSAFPDTQVCYKLATPTEIQLTPQEVHTLLGENNIWCDSGNVSVNYWKWGK